MVLYPTAIELSIFTSATTAFIPANYKYQRVIIQRKHNTYHEKLAHTFERINVGIAATKQQHPLSNETTPLPLIHTRRREMIDQTMTRSTSLIISSLLQFKQPCWASFDDSTMTSATTSTSSNNFIPSQSPDSLKLPTGLLESRVLEKVYSYPPYGMECIDIFYPAWFYGTWNVASTTTSIETPLGRSMFGTNATYQAAVSEIGTTLRYESRFIDVGGSTSSRDNEAKKPATPTTIISDRGYNVQSIATAALGRNSVVDIPLVSANKLTAILAPIGAPNLLRVDLFSVNRRQEYIDDTHFHCSEVVREIVSSVGTTNGNANGRTPSSTASSISPILKEVETTTLYTLNIDTKNPNNISIRGRQRSAKFLVPTQNDAASFRLYEMTRGKPVDVRFYDVVYTKKVSA